MNTKNLIKLSTLLFTVILAFSISSCAKKDSDETLYLPYEMGEFGIYDMLVTGSRQQVHSVTFAPELTTALGTLGANNLTLNSILLNDLDLTVISPAGGNFNGISYFVAYVTATDMDTLEIASIDGLNSANLSTVALTSTGNDMDEYFKQDQCQLLIYAYNTSPVGVLDQLRIDIDFEAVASVTIQED